MPNTNPIITKIEINNNVYDIADPVAREGIQNFENSINNFVLKSGDTMTGTLTARTLKIYGLNDNEPNKTVEFLAGYQNDIWYVYTQTGNNEENKTRWAFDYNGNIYADNKKWDSDTETYNLPESPTTLATYNAKISRTANWVLAAPNGNDGPATFRSLVPADIPNLSADKITAGTLPLDRGGTGLNNYTSAPVNKVFAGPSSGSKGKATFRALVPADIPTLSATKISGGALSVASVTTTGNITVDGTLSVESTATITGDTTIGGNILSSKNIRGLSYIRFTGQNDSLNSKEDAIYLGTHSGSADGDIQWRFLRSDGSIKYRKYSSSAWGSYKLPFSSQSANSVLAAPSTSNGEVTFRALVAADIPNLNASKITAGTFGNARIADGAITTAKIADAQITAGKIAANAVTTDKIANTQITTGKIANNAVTPGKASFVDTINYNSDNNQDHFTFVNTTNSHKIDFIINTTERNIAVRMYNGSKWTNTKTIAAASELTWQ